MKKFAKAGVALGLVAASLFGTSASASAEMWCSIPYQVKQGYDHRMHQSYPYVQGFKYYTTFQNAVNALSNPNYKKGYVQSFDDRADGSCYWRTSYTDNSSSY